MEDKFQQVIAQHQDREIDTATQQLLNRPLQKALGEDSATYQEFLFGVLAEGKINPFLPMSLVRTEYYETLEETARARVDLACVNLCGIIRQVQALRHHGQEHSYQMESLIHTIFHTKERLEADLGDVLYL